jgi:23S rRNA (cytidine1920-2'-O)/16S rRNA (cytidine1409-2'-O)-methyltransferase
MSDKTRLDLLLVQKKRLVSRSRARDLIKRGMVRVDGVAVSKPGLLVAGDADLQIDEQASPYVSRAGLKLAKAMQHFELDATGRVALDLGASTGGFTQVLLQAGASLVYAVDVGHGQLHESLQGDARVISLEGCNVRQLAADIIPEPVSIITADLSFISLSKALSAPLKLAATECWLVALIKPQFEVGKGRVGKGGVVRDPEQHQEVVDTLARFFENSGWNVQGHIPSPILGPKGNREFLIYLTR